MEKFVKFCSLFFVAYLMTPSFGWGQKVSPDRTWLTTHTEHFRIHSEEKLKVFTTRAARILEEAYLKLSRELHWEPSSKIEVIIRHDQDLHGASASVYPLNQLILHPVPFSPVSSISEYDDWIRELIFHELAHIIANDTTSGLFAAGRFVFGSVAKMNRFQPDFVIEGLATYIETRHARGGRGRSTTFNMMARAAAREGLLDSGNLEYGLTIDRLSDGPPIWTAYETPYLYGYIMAEMMAKAGGIDAPGKTSKLNSYRVPFFINAPAEEASGKTYFNLWADSVHFLKAEAAKDLAKLREAGVSKVKVLDTESDGRNSRALLVAGDEIYFIRDSYDSGTGLSRFNSKTSRTEDLSTWSFPGGNRLSLSGKWISYSRIDRQKQFNLYSDIYLFSTETSSEIQLTEGARAMDPDLSPEFKILGKDVQTGDVVFKGQIAYIKTREDANQSLVVWDGQVEKVVFEGKNFSRLSFPTWGKGATRGLLFFAHKPIGKGEEIRVVDMFTGEVSRLRIGDRALGPKHGKRQNISTLFSTQKGSLLYTSNQAGVFNHYEIKHTQFLKWLKARKKSVLPASELARFETGALYPVRDSNQLFSMVYTHRGYELAKVSQESFRPGATITDLQEKINPSRPDTSSAALNLKSEETPYSFWPSILPKLWFPFAQLIPDGWMAGVSTFGHDALELHHYQIIGAFDSRARFPVYDLTYSFDGLYPTISLSRAQENRYISSTLENNRIETTSASFVYPIGRFQAGFGGTLVNSRFRSIVASSGGLQGRVAFSSLRRFGNSIEPEFGENGFYGSLTGTGFFVGQEQFASLNLILEQRIPFFWDQDFFRWVGNGVYSDNESLPSLYYVGGGEDIIGKEQVFLLRGYPAGVLYGRSLVTMNFEYWFPIKNIFRGMGLFPMYYERTKFRVYADMGSSEFVFDQKLSFSRWPIGVGAQLMQDIKVLFQVPLTLALGANWGLRPEYGGEKQLIFGLFVRTL